jgi:hypothetical protein
MGSLRFISMTLLSILSGCSWIGMTRPPSSPVEPTPPSACTTSRAAPVLDTIAAVLIGVPATLVTVGAAATPVDGGWFTFGSSGEKALAVGAGLAVVGFSVMEAFSAADGYSWAGDCEAIQANQLACLSGVEPSCDALRTAPSLRLGKKSTGESCGVDAECRASDVCFLGRCQPRNP